MSTSNYVPLSLTDSDIQRFWAKVALPDENHCMLWMGHRSVRGYGTFSLSYKVRERSRSSSRRNGSARRKPWAGAPHRGEGARHCVPMGSGRTGPQPTGGRFRGISSRDPSRGHRFELGLVDRNRSRGRLMTEIKLSTEDHDIDDLIRYLDGDHHMSVYDRNRVVVAIKAQLPKPAIEEPRGDCVVIDVMARSWMYDDDSEMWINEGMPESRLKWADLLGLYADLPRVYRAEVGDVAPEDTEDYKAGVSDTLYKIHGRLQLLHADAITSERKNALEKAIQAVEELAP